jgi:aspartate carbamoyltransferase catalytic subunit
MTPFPRYLLSITDLSTDHIFHILKTAAAFKKKLPPRTTLAGKTILNCFFENSTRTRISFEAAAKHLGAEVINFTTTESSLAKGETLRDTILNLKAIGADAFVIRHFQSGAPAQSHAIARIPIVNAGDGSHEHPTQALLDAMTIKEHMGHFKGLHVGIIGDIANSRVARSNMLLLKKLGARITVCGPRPMLPSQMGQYGVFVTTDFQKLIPTLDVIMMLRIQIERDAAPMIPSVGDYARNYQLNSTRLSKAKPHVIVMHPGPINRGVELTNHVADGPQSVILQQAQNGVFVRMAVLKAIL